MSKGFYTHDVVWSTVAGHFFIRVQKHETGWFYLIVQDRGAEISRQKFLHEVAAREAFERKVEQMS